jgi:hypothetical protein
LSSGAVIRARANQGSAQDRDAQQGLAVPHDMAFLNVSHGAKPEHLDLGVRTCSGRELIQRTRVPLCEKGDFLLHEEFQL